MKVMLIVDNPARDLAGLVLVAAELARNGATVFITPRRRYRHEIPYLIPDFVVLNYLRKKCPKVIGPLLKYKFQLGVMDTEGGVSANIEDFGRSYVQEPEIREKVVCYLCWGEALGEWIVRNHWYSKEQVCITGNPRFDFYVGDLKKAILHTASEGLKSIQQPMILVNSVFASANPQFATFEQNVQALVKNYGRSEAEIRALFDAERRTMDVFVETVKDLSVAFPQANFVYRPHPFERLETYSSLFKEHSNVFPIKEGSVTPWILAAKAIVHPSCTTGIEARFAGIDSLLPAWIPGYDRLESVLSVSSVCESREKLHSRVREALDGVTHFPPETAANLDKVIKDWFYRVDGLSHKRIAESILERLDSSKSKVLRRIAKKEVYSTRPAPRHALDRIEDWMVRGFEMPPARSFKAWNVPPANTAKFDVTDKRFSLSDVEVILNALNREVPAFSANRVRAACAQESGCYAFGYQGGRSVVLGKQ